MWFWKFNSYFHQAFPAMQYSENAVSSFITVDFIITKQFQICENATYHE